MPINMRHIGWLIVGLSIAAGLMLQVFPPASFSPEQSRAAALVIVTISAWATGILPEYLTALFFFLIAMLFSISPPHVIFSGFESTALWLVFGGLVIGVGINVTGLGNRLAGRVVVHLDGSYPRLIGGVFLLGTVFSFLMPSAMGRAVLLAPIAGAISDYFGFERGANGRTGVILGALSGAVFPAFAILPANVVNMVLAGMSEAQFGISPLYGEYLLYHFPVLGILKAPVVVGLVVWLYPDRPRKNTARALLSNGPVTAKESFLSGIIMLLLVLWMTDFIHRISPAWVALGGALFLLLPGIQIVTAQQFNEKINYGSLFFVAAILGLGGMVSHTGLGDALADRLVDSLPLGQNAPFSNYMLLSLASSLTGIFATLPGVPAVMTPISDILSQVTGLPVKTVLMFQVLGFSTPYFPYQIPSLVVGMQLCGERLSTTTKFFLVLSAITILFLLPINYLWWKLLGGI